LAVFQTAQGGKILKKLTKELKKVIGGAKFEDVFANNIDGVSNNAAGIHHNSEKIYHNADNITSISNDLTEATRCTVADWSGSHDCCTSANPCGFGRGDCLETDDSTCSGDLKCGLNNCLSDFGFGDFHADCCIHDTSIDMLNIKVDVANNAAAIVSISDDLAEATRCTAVDWSGSYDCCTSANPCSIGQGDCNENDHTTCSGDLKCGVNNCYSEFGFGDGHADCCILTGIHDNAANIANNAADISSNDAEILSISNDLAEAAKCTAIDWSGYYDCCTSPIPAALDKVIVTVPITLRAQETLNVAPITV